MTTTKTKRTTRAYTILTEIANENIKADLTGADIAPADLDAAIVSYVRYRKGNVFIETTTTKGRVLVTVPVTTFEEN